MITQEATVSAPRRHRPSADLPQSLTILVHGLAANKYFLRPLRNYLRARGIPTIDWGYPSIRCCVERTAEAFRGFLRELNADDSIESINLVTHSMGGIITRQAMSCDSFEKIDRLVMLAPPNGGSQVARRLAPWLGWFCPALHQLSDLPESLVNRLPRCLDFEIGIIGAAYDRVVAVEKTRLDGQISHLVVPTGHTSMLFRPRVWRLVMNYLRHDAFEVNEEDLRWLRKAERLRRRQLSIPFLRAKRRKPQHIQART